MVILRKINVVVIMSDLCVMSEMGFNNGSCLIRVVKNVGVFFDIIVIIFFFWDRGWGIVMGFFFCNL